MLRTRAAALLLLLALAAATLPFVATPAGAQVDTTSEEQLLLSLHNEARGANGQAALTRNATLDAIAREWAQYMADAARLEHRTDLRAQITSRVTPNPNSWAENIAFEEGTRGTAAVTHADFMNSPGHRSAILDGDFNQVGIGMVWQDGTLWTAVDFLEAPISSAAIAPVTPAVSSVPNTAVTTQYSASEYFTLLDAAAYLNLSPAAFQQAGVHLLRLLNWIVGRTTGTSTTKVAVEVTGPQAVTTAWDAKNREALTWVSGYYQLSDAQSQKAGATLLSFIVSIARR